MVAQTIIKNRWNYRIMLDWIIVMFNWNYKNMWNYGNIKMSENINLKEITLNQW